MTKKNNLVSSDIKRTYPLNKVTDGTATFAEAPCSFMEGIGKMHPKLFNFYEKNNQKRLSIVP